MSQGPWQQPPELMEECEPTSFYAPATMLQYCQNVYFIRDIRVRGNCCNHHVGHVRCQRKAESKKQTVTVVRRRESCMIIRSARREALTLIHLLTEPSLVVTGSASVCTLDCSWLLGKGNSKRLHPKMFLAET